MKIRYYDAHNHLQDPQLDAERERIIAECEKIGVVSAVVNGTRPDDWDQVLRLAAKHSFIIPSIGFHPWHVRGESREWKDRFEEAAGKAGGIGEIGLDRWMQDFDFPAQQEAFVYQVQVANKLGLPVSIHCLKAWGTLLELVRENRPEAGFLLHSYGGPAEIIPSFVKLGGYFSISGYFSDRSRMKKRDVFLKVPRNRLLLETDAPDMLPPMFYRLYKLQAGGEQVNHPANIEAIYVFVAALLDIEPEELAPQIEENFLRLFQPKPNTPRPAA